MPQLDKISQAQRERLFHIDFRLYFLGLVNRTDIVARFGLKEAAASRDLSLYRELAPENLEYDPVAKTYISRNTFKPIFTISASQALSALLSGLGDNFIGTPHPLVSCESPTALNTPNVEILSTITRAIHNSKALSIHYRSMSSGFKQRDIVPLALVDNGLRWHVRAFDRKRDRFTDFVINRINAPKILNLDVPHSQTKDADNQWNRIVEIHIVPHPRLKHPETIEAEYAMVDSMLKVQVRAALAGYVLRRWNVDCTEKHQLTGAENHLWLQNRQALDGVENLVIAPGYENKNPKDGKGH